MRNFLPNCLQNSFPDFILADNNNGMNKRQNTLKNRANRKKAHVLSDSSCN